MKQPVIWEYILGNGKKVSVTYYPRWSYCNRPDLQYRTDHFEFQGDAISPTGYHSEFAVVDPDPDYDGTAEAFEFAKKKIVELSGIGLEGEEWEGQLTLF